MWPNMSWKPGSELFPPRGVSWDLNAGGARSRILNRSSSRNRLFRNPALTRHPRTDRSLAAGAERTRRSFKRRKRDKGENEGGKAAAEKSARADE